MTVTITEIARTESTAYGVSFIVCTNHETNRDTLGLDVEPADELLADGAIDAAEDAAILAIADAGFDWRTESNFHKWHGGPYRGMVHLCWHVADVIEAEGFDDDEQDLIEPEDTRGDWEHAWTTGAGATAVPPEIVAKAEAIQDAAVVAAQAAADQVMVA